MDKLKEVKCFLLDMDGTVHLSGVAIEGAAAAIERMRKRAKVLFLTNNTSLSRLNYVEKLNKMGICASKSDIYTAGNATCDYLNKHHKNKRVFLLGTDALYAEFKSSDINLVNDNPDLVAVGFDTELTYAKLSKACEFIRNGVPYLLTHPDINCPTKSGYIPDVGSFNALIEMSCNGKKPFTICGKPYTAIGEGVAALTGVKANQIAMVGDRLSTDITFAINNSFVPVLVLTGEATKADLQAFNGRQNIVVLNSIADIE